MTQPPPSAWCCTHIDSQLTRTCVGGMKCPLSAALSRLLSYHSECQAGCSFSLLPSSSSHHHHSQQHRCSWKKNLSLTPPPITPSSKDFFGLPWLVWKEWEAFLWIFHCAERMKRKVCSQFHKTCLVLKETATFVVGTKEYSVISNLWINLLGSRGELLGTFSPSLPSSQKWPLWEKCTGQCKSCSHGEAHQIAFLFPERCGQGGNLFFSSLSRWSMALPLLTLYLLYK